MVLFTIKADQSSFQRLVSRMSSLVCLSRYLWEVDRSSVGLLPQCCFDGPAPRPPRTLPFRTTKSPKVTREVGPRPISWTISSKRPLEAESLSPMDHWNLGGTECQLTSWIVPSFSLSVFSSSYLFVQLLWSWEAQRGYKSFRPSPLLPLPSTVQGSRERPWLPNSEDYHYMDGFIEYLFRLRRYRYATVKWEHASQEGG